MGLFKKFVSQTRKPQGVLGALMVSGMNSGHAKLADWGMRSLNGIEAAHIAEIGCGGGRNARKLLEKYPDAKLAALDYSELSVEKTKETNRDFIAAGRCTVVQGSAEALPFEDESFDLVTAFETVYFWPGPEPCFSEIYRVMKRGGTFMICNESDGRDAAALRFEKIIDGMKCYTPEQLAEMLKSVGFSRIRYAHHPSNPWIAVLAEK